jgi:type IV secretory pathway VirB4 component
MLLGQTVTGGNMFLDLWQRDANITNSNYTIIGMSGQGKSYLQKKIISQMVIRGIVTWILDPENEYTHLTRSLGGTVYNCSSGEFIINPFHVRALRTEEDDMDTDNSVEIPIPEGQAMYFQHLSWLHDFYGVLLQGLDLTDLKALDILTQEVYAKKGIDEKTNFMSLPNTEYPIFSDLYAYIETQKEKGHEIVSDDILSKLLLNLHDCAHGSLGKIFNGHTNIRNDRLICFSMGELIQGSAERMKAALFNITTYIWSEICRHRKASMLNVDELYLYLGEENITMVKYLNFFVKRARKYNALIGIATQQLADCLHPAIVHYTTALFNNAATKFLFYPDKIDLELVKQKLQLSDGEMKCISRSNQKHCLVKIGNDRYYMKVGTLPFEKDLFGSAGGK